MPVLGVVVAARLGLRPGWLGHRSGQIFERAHDRGEIDLDRIPPAVLAMPFDLLRHDLLMTLSPIPAERVESIIDDLFLPLIRQYHGGPAPRAPSARR